MILAHSYLNFPHYQKHGLSLCFSCLLFSFLSVASTLSANAGGMELKTFAELNSAEICQKLKEGNPPPSPKEIEEDIARKVLGIGETVNLELIDNSNEEKVTWGYADNSQEPFAVLDNPKEGRKNIKLTVLKNLQDDASIGIKVTNEFGESKKVTFQLKIPREFKGKHTPSKAGNGTVPEIKDKDGNIIPLQPGQTGTVGAAGILVVQVSPTDVSFDNVSIIERANDPDGYKPIHTPNPKAINLNDTSEFQDTVSAYSKGTGIPRGWTWRCSWKVHDNGKDGLLITGDDILQTVTFEPTNHGNKSGVKTTIHKFGCSVSRDSHTGQYNFENPQK